MPRLVEVQAEPNSLAVDVVINNHNYARFLTPAIESALAQTHPRVKVIVVDDGSTDDSREILRAYAGKVELVLKENGGQASALNAGFVRSTADVVIFLDADDVLQPQAASLVANAFASNGHVSKVQYRMTVIDEEGRPTGELKPPDHLPLPSGDVRRAELTFPFDLVWLPTSGNAFSSRALRRIFPIPEQEFERCPDWYLVHLTPLLGRVISLSDVGAGYRVHGRNSYELREPTLDLGHVRQAVAYSAVTTRALERLADKLGLERPHGRILSVSDLSNRLVSLKLDPERHPIRTDRVWRLMLDGTRAAARRFEVSRPMKLLYVGWFGVMAAAPSSLARRLSEYMIFPQRRHTLNRILRRFHSGNRNPSNRSLSSRSVEAVRTLPRRSPTLRHVAVRAVGLLQSIRDRKLSIRDRWIRRRANEIEYWAGTLHAPEARTRFADRLDPRSPIRVPCLQRALAEISATDVSILDVGSGPLTSVGKTFPGKTVTVTATDSLAAEYVEILRQCGIDAPVLPVACSGEELLETFPAKSFDVAFASNALDHSADPLAVLENMLALIKPTGRVALMHLRNEGEQHGYMGLHFWNVDCYGDALVFWNRTVKHDVTARLAYRFQTACWITDDDRVHCLIRPRPVLFRPGVDEALAQGTDGLTATPHRDNSSCHADVHARPRAEVRP